MTIDVRGIGREELFIKLRDVFVSHRGRYLSLEVILDSHNIAIEVAAFASMSGCQADIKKADVRCIVRITGIVCCT